MEKIKSEFGLDRKVALQLNGKLNIDGGEAGNEVVLKCLDCSCSSIDHCLAWPVNSQLIYCDLIYS